MAAKTVLLRAQRKSVAEAITRGGALAFTSLQAGMLVNAIIDKIVTVGVHCPVRVVLCVRFLLLLTVCLCICVHVCVTDCLWCVYSEWPHSELPRCVSWSNRLIQSVEDHQW